MLIHLHRNAEGVEDPFLPRKAAPCLSLFFHEEGMHLVPGITKEPCQGKAVGTVVPRPAEDGDAAGRKPLFDLLPHGERRPLHENEGGDADLFTGGCIGAPHLL